MTDGWSSGTLDSAFAVPGLGRRRPGREYRRCIVISEGRVSRTDLAERCQRDDTSHHHRLAAQHESEGAAQLQVSALCFTADSDWLTVTPVILSSAQLELSTQTTSLHRPRRVAL